MADQAAQTTSVIKISDEFVQLSSREKLLFASVSAELQRGFGTIKAVECGGETKLEDLKKCGLKFRPADLQVARETLKKHGLEQRF